jgi:type I restriction enzyme S subunit
MSAMQWTTKIPPSWRRMKLKHVAKLKSGESITSESIAPEGPFPVYGGNGLRGYTDEYNHEGTHVLIGCQGALCGNVNYAYGKFWASEHAVVASIEGGHDPRWLGEMLRSMNLNQYSQAAAQPGLAVEVISSLEVPVPPLDTQRAIADFLDAETARIDALIAAKESLLTILAEKRRALITQAVTRGLDPSAPMRDSGIQWLGEIPAHWKSVRLKHVATVQSGLALGKTYPKSEPLESYPYLRVANVQDGYVDHVDLSEVKMAEVSVRDAAGCRLRAGDVLMNEGGDADKLGRGAIWSGEIDPCLHQNHVFAVRPEGVSQAWLDLWTSSDGAKAFFESRAKQSTNLASISATNLKELPLPLPPEEEQVKTVANAVSELAKLDAFEGSAETTIALLRERREAVIAAAVTGQLELGAA